MKNNRTVMIFGKTIGSANHQLNELFEQFMADGDVLSYEKNINGYILCTKSGYTLESVEANRKSVGRRCLIALVDKNIPEDIVEHIITPTILPEGLYFYY